MSLGRESRRERTLLRLLESQQQTIRELNDRIMYLAGRTWTPPPPGDEPLVAREPELVSALDVLPGEWEP